MERCHLADVDREQLNVRERQQEANDLRRVCVRGQVQWSCQVSVLAVGVGPRTLAQQPDDLDIVAPARVVKSSA